MNSLDTPNRAIVVLPTYNEADNLRHIIHHIQKQQSHIPNYQLHILIVDDNSPDGTGHIAEQLAQTIPNIHTLHGTKQGLGIAYQRGIQHALNQLDADVVIQMDADFSHKPEDIPRLLKSISQGADFVIGSRYVKHGSIPNNWSFIRVLNSKLGNWIAKYLGGITPDIQDTTGGFRAIRSSLLKKFDFHNFITTGYAIQIELLHKAQQHNARFKEIPIHFRERREGQSKLAIKDITEFILTALWFRINHISRFLTKAIILIISLSIIIFIYYLIINQITNPVNLLITLSITTISLLYLIQGIFNLHLMLYSWEDSEILKKHQAPKKFSSYQEEITLILPARDESKVIKDTLQAISQIIYPKNKVQIIVVCRLDDQSTIQAVQDFLNSYPHHNIQLEIFSDYPINKPHGLNIALKKATGNIIGIFDAEDQPHPQILNIINTTFQIQPVEVVQSGVQLMNYDSKWFSTLNVLEYFFWFKSSLHFYAKHRTVPLGGNTVFFKSQWLSKANGWDETSLTEDADVGLRLSALGARTVVVYDEEYVTKEETPDSVMSFIKQRTRWNQGFLQVLFKGEWLKLPSLKQRLLAFYILLIPELQALGFIFIPISIGFAIYLKLPVVIAILTIIPMILLTVQMIIYNIGIWEFTKKYNLKYSPSLFFKILITYIPFQLLLGFSALRGVYRYIIGNFKWEKTQHTNAHRQKPAFASIT